MRHRSARRYRREHPLKPQASSLRERLARLRAGTAEPTGPPGPLAELEPPSRTTGVRETGARIGLRASIVAVLVVALFAILLVRLWSLQVIQGSSYYKQAELTTTRTVLTPAPRGLICGRAGCGAKSDVLAGNVSEEVVTLSTTFGANGERVASTAVEQRLAALIPGLTLADIKTDLANEEYSPYQPVPVATNVSTSDVLYIDAHKNEFPGVTAGIEYERDYPYGDVGTQTIGYVGGITASELEADEKTGKTSYNQSSIVGQSGLEEEYDAYLQGQPGQQKEEVDPAGDVESTVSTSAATPGDDVVLNMDVPLEQLLQNALASQITCLRSNCDGGGAVPANWGAAVVMTTKGQVLAMASAPTYNDNEWIPEMSESNYESLNNNPDYPLNNYPTVGLQAPGSTFKLATATAALDDGLISPSTYIDDPGTFTIPGSTQVLYDAPGDSGGDFNISTALSYSSDVFFYTLGAWFYEDSSRFGSTPIQNMAKEYGFGESSGVDLPSVEVAPGQVDSYGERKLLHKEEPDLYGPASWYIGDNVELAFGQGETLVTPLEEAVAYATFDNGGTRYAPEMAAGILTGSGKLLTRFAPKVLDHVHYASQADYDAIYQGFVGAVQSSIGTAYQDFLGFNFNTWNLGGKTGTATVSNNPNAQPTAWFVGFGGPKGSSTQYVVAVEINQAGYGADASAPVARQVFNYLYKHPITAPDLPAKASGSHR